MGEPLSRLSSTISRRSSIAMGAAIGTALSRADSLLYTPYKWMIDSLLEDADGDAPLLRLQSFRPTQPRKLLECKARGARRLCHLCQHAAQVCGVVSSNEWNFKSHLLGRKHTRRLAALGVGGRGNATVETVNGMVNVLLVQASCCRSTRTSTRRQPHPYAPRGNTGLVQAAEAHVRAQDDGPPLAPPSAPIGTDGASDAGPSQPTRVIDSDGAPLITIENGQRTIFMCRVCGVSATSARNYLAHIQVGARARAWCGTTPAQGKTHLKNVRKAGGNDMVSPGEVSPDAGHLSKDVHKHMEEVAKVLQQLGQSMPDIPEMPFKCEVCGIYTTSQQLMDGHLAGRKHLKRVAMQLQQSRQGQGGDPAMLAMIQAQLEQPKAQITTPFYCSVCDVYATSEQQLDMHYAGRRHMQAAAGKPQGGRQGGQARGGAGVESDAFHCTLCDVISPNLQQLEYHYRGAGSRLSQTHECHWATSAFQPGHHVDRVQAPTAASTAAHAHAPQRAGPAADGCGGWGPSARPHVARGGPWRLAAHARRVCAGRSDAHAQRQRV